MKPIVPYLWFDHQAEAAVDLYTHTFLHSHVVSNSLYTASGAEVSGRPEGSLLSIDFVIAGQPMVALNGGPTYSFTPANSFYVHCAFPEEVDRIYEKLSAGGEVLMELGAYPFSSRFTWVKDPFGVNWQIMQSDQPAQIVPGFLFTGPHIGQAEAAIQHYIATIPHSKLRVMEKARTGLSSMHHSHSMGRHLPRPKATSTTALTFRRPSLICSTAKLKKNSSPSGPPWLMKRQILSAVGSRIGSASPGKLYRKLCLLWSTAMTRFAASGYSKPCTR